MYYHRDRSVWRGCPSLVSVGRCWSICWSLGISSSYVELVSARGMLSFGSRLRSEFADRPYAWSRWAESDDVEQFLAHITARYPRREPSTPVVAPRVLGLGGLSRMMWCCRRRSSSSLVLFVTADDFGRMAGSGVRSREEAEACFARWRSNVPQSRRWGTAECPSVSVSVDGVQVPRD